MICLAMLLEAESRTFFFLDLFNQSLFQDASQNHWQISCSSPPLPTYTHITVIHNFILMHTPNIACILMSIITSNYLSPYGYIDDYRQSKSKGNCHDVTRKNLDQHYQNQLYISNRTQLNIDETDLLYKRNLQNQWQCAFWEFFLWWKKKKF